MSLICIGTTRVIPQKEQNYIKRALSSIAIKYKRGISFDISWHEPIVDSFSNHDFPFSITDAIDCDLCEMFLLPDGWLYNGKVNTVPFLKRMIFLQEIAEWLLTNNYCLDYYIGLSGALPEEYFDIIVTRSDLPFVLESVMKSDNYYAIHLKIT